MINALVRYYEQLFKAGKLDRPGWSKNKISYAIELDRDGNLLYIHSLKQEVVKGKKAQKTVFVPTEIALPMWNGKKSSNIRANFLWGNAKYLFGLCNDGKEERTLKCFQAAKDLHLSLLKDLDSNCANAIKKFFNTWDPNEAEKLLKDDPSYDELMKDANLVFLIDDEYAHTNSELESVWQDAYDTEDEDNDQPEEICMITGRLSVPARIHPAIKGIKNAQSSGAALSSFNIESACSYGKEQNLNAPMSKYAAFAYSEALNYLTKGNEHKKFYGDTTVVYWADGYDEAYQDVFSALIDGRSNALTDQDLDNIMQKMSQGISVMVGEDTLDPNNRFYIIGIEGNAARLSVKFFYENTFGKLVSNLYEHAKRMELIPDGKRDSLTIPLWSIIETAEFKDNALPKRVEGEMSRVILFNERYPITLYNQIEARIRADKKVSWKRMSIVKAYLLKNGNNEAIKEGLTMKLNEETLYQPYLLGRLFAAMERTQTCANHNVGTTIKDKYFTSACTTPSVVFPTLMMLNSKHLKSISSDKLRVYWHKQILDLLGKITDDFPKHLSLQDQGAFQLGYYHQTRTYFEKRNQEESKK